MKILSIETSSSICSVSLLENASLIKELHIDDANTHSVKLMPLIEKLLKETNLILQDIDLFACDKGPGSFTGIRIGISTIKAFCDVTGKPGVGISSLTALAHQTDYQGLICSLIDAGHDNVYYGLFEHTGENYIQIGQFLSEDINQITEILKNCNKPIFFVGNGSIVYQGMLESSLKQNAIILDKNELINLSATSAGQAAFSCYSSKNDISLSPLYLKKSSAERNLEDTKNGNCS